jgi:hypothetical protein
MDLLSGFMSGHYYVFIPRSSKSYAIRIIRPGEWRSTYEIRPKDNPSGFIFNPMASMVIERTGVIGGSMHRDKIIRSAIAELEREKPWGAGWIPLEAIE